VTQKKSDEKMSDERYLFSKNDDRVKGGEGWTRRFSTRRDHNDREMRIRTPPNLQISCWHDLSLDGCGVSP
jgi:hypothetical protein